MDDDVIERRSEWSGAPESWYGAIPAYPQWIAVDSIFDAGTGVQLRSPTYFTHYRGREYACSQQVEFEEGRHVHVPVVQVYALERISVDDPFPGWQWDPLLRETCPQDQTMAACLFGVRRRLSAIIDGTDGADTTT